ncbi:MAG: EAL domain-containing protein [Gammaproteobacteria bacterium]|nr:MAG: EAL domain-containing protein [Gammaproteobacteria bacterium]
MTPLDTIRLIILNNSRAEAERLISMLHNAGRPSRAQHVDSEEVLVKLLQEQTWDLLIANDNTNNPTPQATLKHIRRLNKDVPVILLKEEEEAFGQVEGMKMGAVDVVSLDNDQHLLMVIQREMANRVDRQARRSADRRFREAERRSQQLLDSSRDAIAYVQDGLYLYANESFAELFGFENRDDIEALPIMDMVADEEQSKLKNFLKEFTLKGEDVGSSQLAFRGVMQDGTSRPINLEVSHVTYDEEPCIQFLARAQKYESTSNNEELQAQINQIKSQDLVTGLYNRQYMIQTLENTIDHIGDQQSFSFLYIELDGFNERVSSAFGVAGSDLVLGDISALLREKVNTTDILARFGDTTFTLLIPNIKADAAVNRALQICKQLENHIIEIDSKTLQLTCSIGVSIINETSTSAGTVIEQARSAMDKVSSAQGNNASLFEQEVTAEDKVRDIAGEVQHALDNDKFRLLFQPIISLRGSEEEYYEVYLRMITESGSEIEPDEFLEAASKINLSIKVDRWVILESIKMLSQHRIKGNKTKLIINLGRQSLCDETLLPWLAVAFKAAKLTPDAITFQANEVDVTNHLNAAKSFAEGLQKLKTQMSITNFGCSLNPFNALKHVAASMIKIDGSFTSDIQHKNESSAALIELIEKLHAENKVTIVPFVENASVLSTLWQAGAHYIQGHYLQEPTQGLNYDFNMES